jgi:ribose transport system substrate-binding protein
MKKLKFLTALITKDNDYQMEQASAAEEAARRLGVDVQVVFADNDSINQSQQLLKVIQGPAEAYPDAIVIEPVSGTALPHVARAAVDAGIGWVVLNHEVGYVSELRRNSRIPVFTVSTDHGEVGRIQGQQIDALVPAGGTIVYIQGPSNNSVVTQRTLGMQETKPAETKAILLHGNWTEESAYRTVSSWMLLSTSQKLPVDMFAAQIDDMAMGARRAVQEHTNEAVRDTWLSLPFIGCDGLPSTGQQHVRRGLLAATVITPPITTRAFEMLVEAFEKGSLPAEVTLITPLSLPPIGDLKASKR